MSLMVSESIVVDSIQELLTRHPGWNRPLAALQAGETNYRTMAMFQELRGLAPKACDDSEPPADWYAACAAVFGIPAVTPTKPKSKQKTLF